MAEKMERYSTESVGPDTPLEERASALGFVPSPLPPVKLDPAPILLPLASAAGALGELAGLGRNLPNPRLLIRPFMRREAVLSSRIEGTQADVADLYAFEAGQVERIDGGHVAKEADVREVHNYVRALEYGLDRIQTLPVSLRLIREMHGVLMEGVRGGMSAPGEFRRNPNWIGPVGCPIEEAVYVPPSVPEMVQLLNQLETFLHDDTVHPPLLRIGLLHYQFEAIHPFIDGNGRVGRLLISLLLVHYGLLPLPLLYLSAFFERNREEYYARLLAVSERAEWEEWLVFFLTGVEEQSRDAVSRAARLQDLQTKWRDQLSRARASALLPKLVDSLFEQPVLTIPRAAELLGITYRPAQTNVQRLVDAGILTQANPGAEYGKLYVAWDVLRAVDT